MPSKLDVDLDLFLKDTEIELKDDLSKTVSNRILKDASAIESTYFKTVSDSMNFFNPPKHLFTFGNPFEGVKWKPLSKRTIGAKLNRPNTAAHPHNKWYFTGDLQEFVKGRQVGSYFGRSSVEYVNGVVSYNSRLENERRPFRQDEELKTSNEDKRPLFEPIREFYVNVILPMRLGVSAEKAIDWKLKRLRR